jgi:hypothetical protein
MMGSDNVHKNRIKEWEAHLRVRRIPSPVRDLKANGTGGVSSSTDCGTFNTDAEAAKNRIAQVDHAYIHTYAHTHP